MILRRAIEVPAPDGRARLRNDPLADRHDESGSLGGLQELAGREQAALGVIPPEERLESDDPTRPHLHDRLIVEEEFTAFERVREIGFDADTATRRAPRHFVEE